MTTDCKRRPREWQLIARHVKTIRRLAAALPLLISCHSDQTGPGRVAALLAEPTSLEVMVNESAQLHGIPQDQGGTMLKIGPVLWASQDPLVASVTTSGRVTGVSIGRTTLVGTLQGVTAEVPVSVIAGAGTVEITVIKLGSAADPQGFRLLIDDQALGDPLSTIGQRSVELPAGKHTVSIENIESRCQLVGETARVVFVVPRQRMGVIYNVACQLPGQLVVKALTTGQRSGSEPYRVTINGGPDTAIDTNGEVRFELPPRKYQVAFSTLDARCVVSAARREVEVVESYPSLVQFQVRCYPTAPSLAGDKLVVSYKSLLGSGLDAMNTDGTVRFPIEESELGAGDAAVSFDGRRLAFRRFAAVGSNLVIVDVATANKSVSPAALRISSLSWSPDGQRLATGLWTNDVTGLAVIRADGSLERELGQRDGAPLTARWAPDGTKIVFTRNGHDVRVVNADGSSVRTLVSSSDRYFDGGEWSADGRTLLVRSYQNYCYYYSWYCYTFDARLQVLDVATGREIRSLPIPEYAFGFVWGSTTAEVYWIQHGDVFYSRLDPFAPVNVTRSPDDEWSVLWGRFEGGVAPAVGSARRQGTTGK